MGIGPLFYLLWGGLGKSQMIFRSSDQALAVRHLGNAAALEGVEASELLAS